MIAGACPGGNRSAGGMGGVNSRGRKLMCPECGRKVGVRPGQAGYLYPHKRGHRCAYCRHSGQAAEFAPFNTAGNLACLDLKGCALRQAGHAGIRPELDVMTAAVRQSRPDCAHAAGDAHCGCRWMLADGLAAEFGYDSDTAALLAAAMWEAAPLA